MKLFFAVVSVALAAVPGMPGAETSSRYSPREKAYYADPKLVQLVQPSLTSKILSAKIAPGGTITAVDIISDPAGLALDSAGITTPGVVSLSFVAAVPPGPLAQYTACSLLVHRIHGGVNLQADNRSYVVVGFGGSPNDFTNGPGGTGLRGTQFLSMSPTGSVAQVHAQY